jgi:acetyltransferase-like isoleucine patch superfamily enzyme
MGFILNIRRGETPFYRFLKACYHGVGNAMLPFPSFMKPLFRLGFGLQQAIYRGCNRLVTFFFREPLFRGRCESIGKRFHLYRMPWIIGHARIFIGDDVNFFGKVDIFSGRIFDDPKLVFGNRVDIGHNVVFVVSKEIVIEDDVNVASGARFMDTDAHPKDTAARIADLPPSPEEIKPVRICRYSWIGQNAFIMKGVTVGEGAVIGAGSVVVSDVPPYAVAMGNPARVILKNVSKPVEQAAQL